MNVDYHVLMSENIAQIEAYLDNIFGHSQRNANIFESMRYSLVAGGKRIRPVLTLQTCKMCGGDPAKALPFACAVEMIHTYSLIHDDLPAMDNSDLRRGRATNHKVFGEATAILAGDGLLTAAFEVLTRAELSAQQITDAVRCLAKAAGPEGMVGGQALDMAGEGRSLSLHELELLQSLKTGALISAAVELGAIAANAPLSEQEAAGTYAMNIGRAFQVRDDILDVISDKENMGKPTGSDQVNEKSTFVSVLGLERCQNLVCDLTAQAQSALECFKPEVKGFHIWLGSELSTRKH